MRDHNEDHLCYAPSRDTCPPGSGLGPSPIFVGAPNPPRDRVGGRLDGALRLPARRVCLLAPPVEAALARVGCTAGRCPGALPGPRVAASGCLRSGGGSHASSVETLTGRKPFSRRTFRGARGVGALLIRQTHTAEWGGGFWSLGGKKGPCQPVRSIAAARLR